MATPSKPTALESFDPMENHHQLLKKANDELENRPQCNSQLKKQEQN